MTCDSLLSNISMVFQKVYLFHDTVENNIRFGNPAATHEEIVEAAKKARCHDFIEQLPDGYKTRSLAKAVQPFLAARSSVFPLPGLS